jgi:hypothetical protein
MSITRKIIFFIQDHLIAYPSLYNFLRKLINRIPIIKRFLYRRIYSQANLDNYTGYVNSEYSHYIFSKIKFFKNLKKE